MGNIAFNPVGPKKSANLIINAELLQQAKQLNINLSQALELHLTEIVRQAQRDQCLAENKDALDDYNRASKRAAHSATDCGSCHVHRRTGGCFHSISGRQGCVAKK